MPQIKSSYSGIAWAILTKDVVCEFRTRYAIGALIMFALTALSSVSLAVAGEVLPPVFTAALLWLVLFFCAMAGLSRSFIQEKETGTLLGLRLYAPGQAVFFGKLLFNVCILASLIALVVPLFVMFLNINTGDWVLFILILTLGGVGIAAVATLIAAMVMYAQGKQAIFTVLTFPVLLPQFLSAINATAKVLLGNPPEMKELIFMAGYDAAVIAAGILMFDYLWQQ